MGEPKDSSKRRKDGPETGPLKKAELDKLLSEKGPDAEKPMQTLKLPELELPSSVPAGGTLRFPAVEQPIDIKGPTAEIRSDDLRQPGASSRRIAPPPTGRVARPPASPAASRKPGEPGGSSRRPPVPETVEVPSDAARALEAPEPTGSRRRRKDPAWGRFSSGAGVAAGPGASDVVDLPRGARVGPFSVEGRVSGSGDARALYGAIDPDGEPVLLEVASTPPGFDVGGFVKNAETAARLDDAHLLRLVDAGEDGGRLFVAYDVRRGRSLDLVIEVERVGPERAARIVRDAALGLAAAHGAGLAHGSLSPRDVLVDDESRARVVGLGRPRTRALLREGEAGDAFAKQPLASPARFAAPERLATDSPGAPDAMADVWSLGAILYASLALVPPFAGLDEARAGRPPELLRSVCASCPPQLEAIAHRAMARSPSQRYASARELAADLDRVLVGKPPEAPAPSRRERLLVAYARRRRAVVAGAVALLLLVVTAPAPLLLDRSRSRSLAALRAGRDLLASGRSGDAISKLEEAARALPSNGEAWRELRRARVDARRASDDAASATRRAEAAELLARARRHADSAREARARIPDLEKRARTLDGVIARGERGDAQAQWAAAELGRRDELARAAESDALADLELERAAALGAAEARAELETSSRERLSAIEAAGEPAALAFANALAGLADAAPIVTVTLFDRPVHGKLLRAVADELAPAARTRGETLSTCAHAPRRAFVEWDGRRSAIASGDVVPYPLDGRLLLPSGSWLAVVRAGDVDVLLPVRARAGTTAPLALPPSVRLGPGWAVIPRGGRRHATTGFFAIEVDEVSQEEAGLPGPSADPKMPARGLTFSEAKALAERLGGRLPTVEELETAARGGDDRRYPWGDAFDGSIARGGLSFADDAPRGPEARTAATDDVSPFGVRHLAGNVAEWATLEDGKPARFGGSFRDVDPRAFACDHWIRVDDPGAAYDDVGLRIVKDLGR